MEFMFQQQALPSSGAEELPTRRPPRYANAFRRGTAIPDEFDDSYYDAADRDLGTNQDTAAGQGGDGTANLNDRQFTADEMRRRRSFAPRQVFGQAIEFGVNHGINAVNAMGLNGGLAGLALQTVGSWGVNRMVGQTPFVSMERASARAVANNAGPSQSMARQAYQSGAGGAWNTMCQSPVPLRAPVSTAQPSHNIMAARPPPQSASHRGLGAIAQP